MSEVIIRQETKADQARVYKVQKQAFERENEAELVEKLRDTDVFIPELSLLAELNSEIVGHILFTRITIMDGENIKHSSLALAPMAVLPEFQNKGIGSLLIKAGLAKAAELGHKSVIVLGHAEYYPKFGFLPAIEWDIRAPFDVPEEALMAVELVKDGLSPVAGLVIYPEEFYSV